MCNGDELDFANKFPSLKDKQFADAYPDEPCELESYQDFHPEVKVGDWLRLEDIENHCLDKQRVKEAICDSEDCYLEIANQEQSDIIIRLIRDLKDELGLNDG